MLVLHPHNILVLKAAVIVSWCLQVMVNEEVDPALVIKRLKQEIRDLKDEIRFDACLCWMMTC